METTNKGHWKKQFNYNYLGAYSLPVGQELIVTIKETRTEKVKGTNGKEETCFVCYFVESEKPMILNKTNCKRIAKLYDNDIEGWIGKKIQIFSQKVTAFGEETEALRVRDMAPAAKIDNREALEKINSSKTFSDLQANYTSLSKDLQADGSVIAAKDAMKVRLKPN